MNKFLLSAASIALLASCASKSSQPAADSSAEAQPAVTEAPAEQPAPSPAAPAAKFAYTLDEDVVYRAFRLLGKDVVVSPDGEPLTDEQFKAVHEVVTAESRSGEPKDEISNFWLYSNGDVYFGCEIYCLKRKDGKFNVIRNCTSTIDDNTEFYRSDYYLLDGESITKTESFLPSVPYEDIVDEFDEWAYTQLAIGDVAELRDVNRRIAYVATKEDDTRDLVLRCRPCVGGTWFHWDGESFTKSDEVCTRADLYTSDGSIVGFEFGMDVPKFPAMKHYSLTNDNQGNVTLLKDGTPVIKFVYVNGSLERFTPLTLQFAYEPGNECRPFEE